MEDLRTELRAAKQTITPQIEGLHDLGVLNLLADSKPVIEQARTDYERRLLRINEALTQLDALEADHYPDMPTRNVLKEVYDDLQNNVDTISAAFAKFAPIEEAASAIITPGAPESKPPTP